MQEVVARIGMTAVVVILDGEFISLKEVLIKAPPISKDIPTGLKVNIL